METETISNVRNTIMILFLTSLALLLSNISQWYFVTVYYTSISDYENK